MGKVIIFSAPSGAGKSTIVNYLLKKNWGLEFSVSATCRAPRGNEQHGKEYYFLLRKNLKSGLPPMSFWSMKKYIPDVFMVR